MKTYQEFVSEALGQRQSLVPTSLQTAQKKIVKQPVPATKPANTATATPVRSTGTATPTATATPAKRPSLMQQAQQLRAMRMRSMQRQGNTAGASAIRKTLPTAVAGASDQRAQQLNRVRNQARSATIANARGGQGMMQRSSAVQPQRPTTPVRPVRPVVQQRPSTTPASTPVVQQRPSTTQQRSEPLWGPGSKTPSGQPSPTSVPTAAAANAGTGTTPTSNAGTQVQQRPVPTATAANAGTGTNTSQLSDDMIKKAFAARERTKMQGDGGEYSSDVWGDTPDKFRATFNSLPPNRQRAILARLS